MCGNTRSPAGSQALLKCLPSRDRSRMLMVKQQKFAEQQRWNLAALQAQLANTEQSIQDKRTKLAELCVQH
eukprot:4010308-Pyramimonas_sp.AAC.1